MTKLIWISCPHCGTVFRVAIPEKTKEIWKISNKQVSYRDWGFGYVEKAIPVGCPKCKKTFAVIVREDR